MAKIALAGATSSIGLAIRQQLDAHCGHDYIVLVRQHKGDDSRAVTVDYTSTEALKETLRAHSIDTVISAISIANEASGIAQLNLIEAATQATCVKRFLPSEYGANYTEDTILHTPSYAYKLKARELLAQSNLEYSIVSIGIYLDYWSCPYIPSILDPQKRAAVFIDLAHNFAAIPGDGSIPVAFTHSKDVARFIWAMLDLPSWPKDCFFAGDRLTLSEFLSLAEDAKGTKFEVHYDTQEKLEAGEVTVNPGVAEKFPFEHAKFFMKELSLSYLKGGLDLPPSKCRNDILSDGKWLRVQDVLDAWRSG